MTNIQKIPKSENKKKRQDRIGPLGVKKKQSIFLGVYLMTPLMTPFDVNSVPPNLQMQRDSERV